MRTAAGAAATPNSAAASGAMTPAAMDAPASVLSQDAVSFRRSLRTSLSLASASDTGRRILGVSARRSGDGSASRRRDDVLRLNVLELVQAALLGRDDDAVDLAAEQEQGGEPIEEHQRDHRGRQAAVGRNIGAREAVEVGAEGEPSEQPEHQRDADAGHDGAPGAPPGRDELV